MWIMITYKRPEQCKQVLEQIIKMGCTSKGVLCINGSGDYTVDELPIPDGWTVLQNKDNPGFIATLNNAFYAYQNEKFYGFISDDEFVFTPGWDKRLIEAAGDWGVSNANDGWQSHTRFHSYCCIGGDLARCVGFLALPNCWHWYGFDNFWEYIIHLLNNRKFCYGVNTEHRHWMNGKVDRDDSYVSADIRKEDDKQIYMAWLLFHAKDLITKIKGERK